MNRTTRAALTAAIPAIMMSSCSSEDERLPLGESLGYFSAEDLTFTANGHEVDFPTAAQIERVGYWKDNVHEGEMSMTVSSLLGPVKNMYDALEIATLTTTLRGLATESDIHLSGVWEGEGGLSIDIEAEVYFPTPSERRLRVNADYRMESAAIVGKTYEISFDDGSIYCETEYENTAITVSYGDGEEYTPGGVAEYVFRQMNKFYVRNSDYDRARVTFHPDCRMELQFHSTLTGSYEPSGFSHRYLATDTDLFIFEGMDWLQEQAPYYKMASDIITFPMIGRQQYLNDPGGNGICGGILCLEYAVGDDGTMRTVWRPTPERGFPRFMWEISYNPFDPSSKNTYMVNKLLDLSREDLVIRPIAIFHEVAP